MKWVLIKRNLLRNEYPFFYCLIWQKVLVSIRPNTKYSVTSGRNFSAQYQKLRENGPKTPNSVKIDWKCGGKNFSSCSIHFHEFFRQNKCKSNCSIQFDEFSCWIDQRKMTLQYTVCGKMKNLLSREKDFVKSTI